MSEDILIALFDIHSFGFVHRDIRLPNILYDPNTKKLILNDFKNAGKNNDILDLDLQTHYGVIKKDQNYHKVHEMICFENLINNENNKTKEKDQNLECKDFLSKFEIVTNSK